MKTQTGSRPQTRRGNQLSVYVFPEQSRPQGDSVRKVLIKPTHRRLRVLSEKQMIEICIISELRRLYENMPQLVISKEKHYMFMYKRKKC